MDCIGIYWFVVIENNDYISMYWFVVIENN